MYSLLRTESLDSSFEDTRLEVLSQWNSPDLAIRLLRRFNAGLTTAIINPAMHKMLPNEYSKTLLHMQEQAGGPMVYLCSSGSTGKGSIIGLSHDAIRFNSNSLACHLQTFKKRHLFLIHVPLFHAFGLSLCLLHGYDGNHTIQLTEKFHPQAFVDFVSSSTNKLPLFIPFVPRMLESLEALPNQESFPQITGITVTGGDLVEAHHLRTLRRLFPSMRHTIGYGLTEAGPALCHTSLDESDLHPRQVGKPLPGVQIKLTKNKLAHFTSPGQCSQIYDLASKTLHATESTLISTGDILEPENEGFLFRTRHRWAINKMGELIPPALIKEKAKALLGEAVNIEVFPVNTEGASQKIGAIIVGARGHEHEKALREKLLALPKFYRPDHLVFKDEIPTNALGKLDLQSLNPFI